MELRTISVPLEDVDIRDSGAGDGSWTFRGHAAVFNRLSMDLGGFQEKIAPRAFTDVLNRNPSVLAVWDHDTRYTLANTANNTLELREDPIGLHMWGRAAPTSYAADLRILMERGDISQASFMFTIADESWEWSGDDADPIVATINTIGELYDVTITGRGAYPQTDASVVASFGHTVRLANALRQGRVPGLTYDEARTRGLVTEDPERGPHTAGEDDAVRHAADVAARAEADHAHRIAVEQARRRRANI